MQMFEDDARPGGGGRRPGRSSQLPFSRMFSGFLGQYGDRKEFYKGVFAQLRLIVRLIVHDLRDCVLSYVNMPSSWLMV